MNFNFLIIIIALILFSCGKNDIKNTSDASIENKEMLGNIVEKSLKDEWIESSAIVRIVSKENGIYDLSLSYDIPDNLTTSFGTTIASPIIHRKKTEKKPINNQRVRVKFFERDPVIFKFIDQILFEE